MSFGLNYSVALVQIHCLLRILMLLMIVLSSLQAIVKGSEGPLLCVCSESLKLKRSSVLKEYSSRSSEFRFYTYETQLYNSSREVYNNQSTIPSCNRL
ncbi:hypothetical protein F5879DRAFT_467875 [Lentinula edodes]|uniref:uncharacterized protein n=1 Tax=Lentinula edodes TaxID=5353 RepID=UPI001E8DE6DD|nr:uncharacterized protein C8R40DRAFT_582632 [Lentinula edodes]KAH7879190.1 hypothetical protein C8R40DRAFT_582632 [Lentinula edodes]KAJ3899876.1 hypothetical protein F5879DRAFT_467875 [Lentinula edodes]